MTVRTAAPKTLTSIVPRRFGEQYVDLARQLPDIPRAKPRTAALLTEADLKAFANGTYPTDQNNTAPIATVSYDPATATAFEASYTPVQAAPDGFAQWLKQQADAVGKGNLVNVNFDWEGAFKKVIRNALGRSPRHRNNPDTVDELAHEILLKMNSEKIAQFDPTKGASFEQFILRFVQFRVADYIKGDHDVNRRKELPPSEDGDTNDPLDTLSGPDNSTSFNLDYDQLVREIFDHLAKTNRAEWYTKIFRYTLMGESSADIARKEGVSSGIISRYIKGLDEELQKYAEATDNDLLLRLLQSRTTKRHFHTTGSDEALDIGNAFMKYKQMTTRAASIEAKQVKIVHKEDLLSPDVMGTFIQSQYVSDKELEANVDDFVSQIGAADDILEIDGGELSFLFSDEPKADGEQPTGD